jgi:predicted transcriptional regulator
MILEIKTGREEVPSTSVTIKLSPEIFQALEEVSKRHYSSKEDMCRLWIECEIREEQTRLKALSSKKA